MANLIKRIIKSLSNLFKCKQQKVVIEKDKVITSVKVKKIKFKND